MAIADTLLIYTGFVHPEVLGYSYACLLGRQPAVHLTSYIIEFARGPSLQLVLPVYSKSLKQFHFYDLCR